MKQPPAGWYPDPSRRFEQRYHDGSQWTDWVFSGGEKSQDPIANIPPDYTRKTKTRVSDVGWLGFALVAMGIVVPMSQSGGSAIAGIFELGLVVGVILLIAAFFMWIIKVGVSSARP